MPFDPVSPLPASRSLLFGSLLPALPPRAAAPACGPRVPAVGTPLLPLAALAPPLGAAALAACDPLPVPAWLEVDVMEPAVRPPLELGGSLVPEDSEPGSMDWGPVIVPSLVSPLVQLLQ
jgi:hypothetical protein